MHHVHTEAYHGWFTKEAVALNDYFNPPRSQSPLLLYFLPYHLQMTDYME